MFYEAIVRLFTVSFSVSENVPENTSLASTRHRGREGPGCRLIQTFQCQVRILSNSTDPMVSQKGLVLSSKGRAEKETPFSFAAASPWSLENMEGFFSGRQN